MSQRALRALRSHVGLGMRSPFDWLWCPRGRDWLPPEQPTPWSQRTTTPATWAATC